MIPMYKKIRDNVTISADEELHDNCKNRKTRQQGTWKQIITI